MMIHPVIFHRTVEAKAKRLGITLEPWDDTGLRNLMGMRMPRERYMEEKIIRKEPKIWADLTEDERKSIAPGKVYSPETPLAEIETEKKQ